MPWRRKEIQLFGIFSIESQYSVVVFSTMPTKTSQRLSKLLTLSAVSLILSACSSSQPEIIYIQSDAYRSSCASLGTCETFALEQTYFTGTVNVEPSHGGRFVYAQDTAPATRKSPPVVLGKIPRHNWEFFSPDEEEALLELRDKKLEQRERNRLLAERKKYLSKASKLDWPKVIKRDGQICVPELEFSNSSSWKDHLTCYDVKGDQ